MLCTTKGILSRNSKNYIIIVLPGHIDTMYSSI